MRTIAARHNTSLSNIYNYYPSKAAILREVIREASQVLLERLAESLEAAGPDVSDRLEATVRTHVKYYLDSPDIGTVATSEFRYLTDGDRDNALAARDKIQAMLTRVVDAGVKEGRFHTPYPHEASLAILTMCSAVVVWFKSGGGMDKDEVANCYARLALALLEADAPR